jgi:predicted ArsR family transcriptional regulator
VRNHEGRKSRPEGPLGPRPGVAPRALSASPTAILETLRRQREPVTLAALALQTGLHPNTVREHLESLVHRGLVSRSRAEPEGRGRPAWLYGCTPARSGTPEYAGLAEALASALARTSREPYLDAVLSGAEWGHRLAHDRGAAPTDPEAARTRVVELLDDLGFEPRQEPGAPASIRLTRCPLLDAARRHPDIVCGVHLGVVRGALEEHGASPEGSALVPFAEPGACRLVVPPLVQPEAG